MDQVITIRNDLEHFLYTKFLKKLFFRFDPEKVHDTMTNSGIILGKTTVGQTVTKWLFGYQNRVLEQTIAGIHFKNPIGLSAGFDKDGLLTQIMPSVGFGYEEIGSVTGKPCEGNPGKRLWRLPKSQSLVVYYGLKNDGAQVIAKRLSKLKFRFPIGISIAKTNNQETVDEQAGINDYVSAYMEFVNVNLGDYFTINISCPNTYGGEPFTDPDKLGRLLTALRTAAPVQPKPVFLKLPAELPLETIDRIVAISRTHHIAGFICTNLAKSRENENILDNKIPTVGGMSGKVVQNLSDDLIAHLYRTTGKEFIIIGCGGIFSAEDAYKKIKRGASLLQLITGMIFEGPQVISSINQGLVELLKRDGYKNISEAVGSEINT